MEANSSIVRPRSLPNYLADEVIPEVDRRFRTLPVPEARAVAGRSSGGFEPYAWVWTDPRLSVSSEVTPAMPFLM